MEVAGMKKKLDSDHNLAIGLALGMLFGLLIENLALGLCLGLVFGSSTKFKSKNK